MNPQAALPILFVVILISSCIQEEPLPAPSTVTPSPASTAYPEDEAYELHKKGWLTIIEKSETDFYSKYSFYTSRVLVVKHPEIYLKSDLTKAQTYPLEITLETLQKYTIIEFQEIYPVKYPVFPFLDRRNFPLFLTMHSDTKLMTQIDRASAYYVYLRLKNVEAHNTFIIYCDNQNSYIYSQGTLVFMKNLQPVNTIDGNPVLIFNENCAWYPLMGRTTNTDPSGNLSKIVTEFSTEKVEPELSEFEKEIVTRVTQITDIDLSVALQLTEFSWHDDPPSITYLNKQIHCALMLTLADYLSPIPAYLATIEPQSSVHRRIQAIGDEFLSHIRVHNYLENPGDETDNTADSSYYTGIAACGPKSFPLSVALDFAGIETYVVSGKDIEKSGHFWLYIKEYDLLVSNGHVSKQSPFVYGEGRFKLIDYIGYKMEGLSFVWQNGKFSSEGNLSPAVVSELLIHVHEKYNDEIGGVNNSDGRREIVALQKVIETLEMYTLHVILMT